MRNEVIRLDKVTQIVDGVTLLGDMNLQIFQGEIMGLLCINAYGQEALIQLLSQNVPIHYGYVYFQEQLVNSYKRSSMSLNRVSIIEKRSRLIEDLTMADNIFVLRRGFKKFLIDPKTLKAQLELFTKDLDINIDGGELVANLTFFEKFVTELLKAVITGVKLVVLRDISNFVGAADLVKIQGLLRHYAAQGFSFLYICNHHEELFKICDRIALMENGKIVKVLSKNSFQDELILHYTLDFCRTPPPTLSKSKRNGVLKLEGVVTDNIKDMSVTVEKGECVVFLDISNTVLTDMMELMTGDLVPDEGKLLLDGEDFLKNTRQLGKSLCFIKENPIQSMLLPEMSYIDNLCFPLDRKQPLLWLDSRIKKGVVQEYAPLIGEDIYATDITYLSPLSLYNLIYYRVHLYHPKVVICAQPFAGADMYLRHHLIHLINELRARKITVIILAVSLSDSLKVADRLLTIEQGRLNKEYSSEEFRLLRMD